MAEDAVTGLAITAVAVPHPGDEGTERAAGLRACRAIRDAHHLATWGNLDRGSTLREDQEYWRGTEYEERLQYLATLDGVPAGTCSVLLPLKENTTAAWIDVLVAARYRRQGIGRRLLAVAEEAARGRGRKVLQGYCEEPVRPQQPGTEELPAKSGSGTVPLDLASTRFAMAAGYELGELAAFTVMSYRPERPLVLIQEDTLVAGPHRGRRLGMVAKIANIRFAQELCPAAESVITWNASENRHMLAINISLGFKPAGFEGEWQKRLE